jgi:GNAT superfamily N-acetyltransferase
MSTGLTLRLLARDEIALIWTIDRSEEIDGFYVLEAGELVLVVEEFLASSWHPDFIASSTPDFERVWDTGGQFWGAFDGATLAGIAVLLVEPIGEPPDMVQLEFLHVSRPYRNRGLGRRLFLHAAEQARRLGARRLYISATPSRHTVSFYTGIGCYLSPQPVPALLEREPEDIHLEYRLNAPDD